MTGSFGGSCVSVTATSGAFGGSCVSSATFGASIPSVTSVTFTSATVVSGAAGVSTTVSELPIIGDV